MSQDLVAATDPKLLRRLLRPIETPGVIDSRMGWDIVARSQQFTNRLPLVFDITQRWNPKIGFQGEKIPIVYAQPQPQETPTTRSISAELGQSPSSQRTVVQAKFVTGSDRAHKLVQTTNSKASETPTPQDFLAPNPSGENFTSSKPTVVQAKFMGGTDSSFLLPTPTPISATLPIEKPPLDQSYRLNSSNLLLETQAIDLDRQVENLSRETSQNPIPIVRARSQPLPASDRGISLGESLPSVQELRGEAIAFDSATALPNLSAETIQNHAISDNPSNPKPVATTEENRATQQINNVVAPISQIPNPIGWSGLEIPLLFSHPRVNPESVQAELGLPNPGITGISRNQPMSQTTGLSREVSLNLQFHQEFNTQQSNRQDSSNIEAPIDLEALTDKVERNLMQRLIIESERRGRTTWS
ncbi:hypothetical protein NIES2107_11150 [Nostoc carneum NIES-2107]|nr:hypothetical protein NIES2107_11150 [Nostoc carneum NIES-2107]